MAQMPLLALMVLDWTVDGSCGKHREFLAGWVDMRLGNLERWSADRAYVATDEFTIADILMAHVLHSGIKDEGLIKPCPGVCGVPGSVPGPARVEADFRGLLRSGGGGVDRQRLNRWRGSRRRRQQPVGHRSGCQ